jgi:hypothetical protein
MQSSRRYIANPGIPRDGFMAAIHLEVIPSTIIKAYIQSFGMVSVVQRKPLPYTRASPIKPYFHCLRSHIERVKVAYTTHCVSCGSV